MRFCSNVAPSIGTEPFPLLDPRHQGERLSVMVLWRCGHKMNTLVHPQVGVSTQMQDIP